MKVSRVQAKKKPEDGGSCGAQGVRFTAGSRTGRFI